MKCVSCSADVGANDPKCGACGTAVPVEAAAPKTSGQTGWGTEVQSLQCGGCGAQMIASAAVARCAYCGSEKVLAQPPPAAGAPPDGTVRPDYLVPFKIEKDKTAEIFRSWLKGLWFAPNDLKTQAQAGAMRGVYLPYWSFDADTSTWYECDIGKDYQIDEPYTEKNAQGQTVQKIRKVTKTNWSSAWGWNRNRYQDLLVLASKGVDRNLMQKLEPFKMEERQPYAATALSGWEAERYAIDSDMAWRDHARPTVEEKEKADCEHKVKRERKADRVRNLNAQIRYVGVESRHLLLPVFISAYQYQGKTFQFAINGQTGKAHGERPKSVAKILIAVGIVLALIVGVILILPKGSPKPPEAAMTADAWNTRANAKTLAMGEPGTGYARKLTAEEFETRTRSDSGSWWKIQVTSEQATVRLEHAQGLGADIDIEVEDDQGNTLDKGIAPDGPETVRISGGPRTIFVRVYYYKGKPDIDLFEYKLKVTSGW